MRLLKLAPLFFVLAAVSPAFGQAFTGPATITQPTTPGDCVKVDTDPQSPNNLLDTGAACGGGGGSGTVTEVDTGTGLTGGPITTSGTVALKPAAAGEIGGVNSSAAVTHNFLTAISTAGVISKAQPACADISDAGTGCSGAASAAGANPTATIGASAVNGSAVTFMRSDAAPALPATLPALNGSLLTALNGANIIAGSVTNAALANSTTTINGTSIALGASGTVTAAAGTLTGGTLASGVLASSLTSVGTLTGGATGTGFTVALTTSTVTGTLADARLSTNVPLKNAANAFTSMQVFNLNTAGAPTPITGAVVQIVGADAANGFVENDTFGATPIFTGRRADGTGASPTAVQSAEALAGFSARPYDGTGYTSASTGNVQAVASEPFSGTNHGTDLVGNCTAITTVTTAECFRAKSSGFTIPTGSTYQINGTQIGPSNLGGLGTGVATLLGGASSGTGGPAGTASPTFTGTITTAAINASNITSSTNVQLGAAGLLIWNGLSVLRVPHDGALKISNNGNTNSVTLTAPTATATPTLQIGDIDVDTGPIVQTLRTQGVLAGGTSNVAGANWTLIASPGKGTGKGVSFLFQTTAAGSTGTVVGTPVTTLSVDAASGVLIPASFPFTMGKATDPGTAPGAAFCKTYWVAGTNANTGKEVAYCGTSTTPVTIIDNVGGGF